MLVIRQAQIDTMVKGTHEEFVEFIATHIKGEKPEIMEEREDDELRRMVSGGIRRSESHGFSRAEDITAFVSVMFEISPNFDEEDEIAAALDDEKMSPAVRLEYLWTDSVPEEVWERAAENKSEESWFDEKFAEEVESKEDAEKV